MKDLLIFFTSSFVILSSLYGQGIDYDKLEADSSKLLTKVDTTTNDTTYNYVEYYTIDGINEPDIRPWFSSFVTKEQVQNALRNNIINRRISYAQHVKGFALIPKEKRVNAQLEDTYNSISDVDLQDRNRAEWWPQYKGFYVVSIDTSAYPDSLWSTAEINAGGRAILRAYVNDSTGVGRPITNWGQAINRDSIPTYDMSTELNRIRLFPETPNGIDGTNTLARVVFLARPSHPGGFTNIASEEVAYAETIFRELEGGVFRVQYVFRSGDNSIIITKVK